MTELDVRINRFFHRWQAFENTAGVHRASVLDFDFCQRTGLEALSPVFASRFQVLDELQQLQGDVASSSVVKNPGFLGQKLKGAECYIRAIQGEVIPFERCVFEMMGFYPQKVSADTLAESRERLRLVLAELGLSLTKASSVKYAQDHILHQLGDFEGRLRAEASLWLKRLEEMLGLKLPLESGADSSTNSGFSLEVVNEDAYWANWIDGSRLEGIRLKANTHPRIRYNRSSHITLAAHEIAGHAAHVLSLCKAEEEGVLDPCALNLTVHSCEAYHMEGLAQAVVHLMGDFEQLPAELRVREALSSYHQALVNNAHIDLEGGKSVDSVYEDVLHASPFIVPLSLRSNLRDRRRSPLFRTYQFVYGPAREHFLRARQLTGRFRAAFVHEIYHSLKTPQQIQALLDEQLEAQAASLLPGT